MTATLVFQYDMSAVSGTTVSDLSGNGLNGTLVNFAATPVTEAGPSGTGLLGLTFTRASQQKIDVGAAQALLDLSSFSIAAWVKITETDTPDNNWEIMEKYGCYWLNVRDGSQGHIVRFAFSNNGTPVQCDSPTAFPRDGTWHHLAGTFNGTILRLYIDGVQVSTLSSTAAPVQNDLALSVGAKTQTGVAVSNYMQGALADVRVYNGALTAAEVASIAGVGTGGGTSLGTDQEFSGLVTSPQYITAGSIVMYGACRNPGGVYLFRQADTQIPLAPVRIDNGNGAPAFVGCMDLAVVQEGANDVLYAVIGPEHATSAQRGVWKCVLTGDVAGNSYTVTWTQMSTGLPTATSTSTTSESWWTSIVAHRIGSATNLAICNYGSTTAATGTYTLSTGATASYVKTHWRSLDGGTTWACISNAANVADRIPVYGKSETWDALTDATTLALNNDRLGGTGHAAAQLTYDPATQTLISYGEGGVWRCDNPWATTPTWKAMVSGLGGTVVRNVTVDPTNNLRLFASDADRGAWRWANGGVGQPNANFFDSFTSPNVLCVHYDNGVAVAGCDDGKVYRNIDPWDATAPVTKFVATQVSPGGTSALGIIRFRDGAPTPNNVWLVVTTTGGVRRSTDEGSTWATVLPSASLVLSSVDAGGKWFVHKDRSNNVYLFVPHVAAASGGGLWRSVDAGATWTRIWQKVLTTAARHHGRIAQDVGNENTLYCTFDDGGVWRVDNAHSGSIGASAKAIIQGVADRQGIAATADRAVVNAAVVDCTWAVLQTTNGGAIASNNPIDQAIASARTINNAGGNIRLKLRVHCGIDSPTWAKNLDGGPIANWHDAQPPNPIVGDMPIWWGPNFALAYTDLMTKLAALYDSEPLLLDVVISMACTQFAEPFIRQAGYAGNGTDARAKGYTPTLDKAALRNQIDIHKAVWLNTASSMAFNPYTTLDAGTTQEDAWMLSTITYMRNTLGVRGVVGNNSGEKGRLNGAGTPSGAYSDSRYGPMYDALINAGPPSYIQTATAAKLGTDWPFVLNWCANNGINMVELPSGYTAWDSSQLAGYDTTIEANPTGQSGSSSGAITATQSADTSKVYTAITSDPVIGDVVACVPTWETGGANIYRSPGGSGAWTTIADSNYADLGAWPLDVSKVDDVIYVATNGAGVFVGDMSAQSTVIINVAASDSATASEGTSQPEPTASDTGTLTETVSIGVVSTDSGSLTETREIGPSQTDGGTLTETPRLAITGTASDSLTLVESGSLATSNIIGQTVKSDADAATLADSGSQMVTGATSDSFVATDAGSVTTAHSGTDTLTVSEAVPLMDRTSSDSASVTETALLAVTGTDSATFADIGSIDQTGTNTVTLSDAGSVVAIAAGSDSISMSEAALATVPSSTSDTATATDTGSLVASASRADSATHSDAGTMTAAARGTDTGTLTETAGPLATSTSDNATLTDTGRLAATLVASENAVLDDSDTSLVTAVGGTLKADQDGVELLIVATITATLPDSDSVSLTENGIVGPLNSDSATLSETGVLATAGTGIEPFTLTDTAGVLVDDDPADTIVWSDSGTINAAVVDSDALTLTEGVPFAGHEASGTDTATTTDGGIVWPIPHRHHTTKRKLRITATSRKVKDN